MLDDSFASALEISSTRRACRGFKLHRVTRCGAWHPVVHILELLVPASGLIIRDSLIIRLPKKLDNFSTQDYGFLSPASF